MIGKPGIEFDARKFEYIGIPTQDNVACAFTKASGITTFDALKNAKTPVKLGGVAPGDTTYNTAKLLIGGAEAADPTGRRLQRHRRSTTRRRGRRSGRRLLAVGVDQIDLAPGARLRQRFRSCCKSTPSHIPSCPRCPTPSTSRPMKTPNSCSNSAATIRRQSRGPTRSAPGTPKDRVQLLRKAFAKR